MLGPDPLFTASESETVLTRPLGVPCARESLSGTGLKLADFSGRHCTVASVRRAPVCPSACLGLSHWLLPASPPGRGLRLGEVRQLSQASGPASSEPAWSQAC